MRRPGRRIDEEEPRIGMTPMIDVTFLLLVFFMCTLQFKTLEGKLAAYLPKDVGAIPGPADPVEKVEVVLRVLAPGTRLEPAGGRPWSGREGKRFRYGGDRVIEYAVGPRRTTERGALARRLAELHRQGPARPLAIDARRGVVLDEVIGVIDAALDAGFEEVHFVGSGE